MKGLLGVFLSGAIVAFLLDPESGQGRRKRVADWMTPLLQRVRRTTTQVVESDTVTTLRESTAPAVAQTLQHAAGTVQERVSSASSTVVERAGQAFGRRGDDAGDASETQTEAPRTMEDYRAEVGPRPGIDPIPEGETNDPTLVARVESELFRDQALPKGKLNIDAANGVVTLRGTLDDDALADDILERTRAVEGVEQVVDLLHRQR